jgi:RimJ/RimL family protein N-acetyltransferase
VFTPRLALVSLPEASLRQLAAGYPRETERRLGVRFPPDFAARIRHLAAIRLRDVQQDPSARPWLLRLIALRTEPPRQVVGLIGFHGRPDAAGRAEIGYEVFAEHRRRGYAREATTGLLDWATRRHGVRRFLAAIAPDNEASMQLALGLGFRQVGAQVDEDDGVELLFELAR